jgi:hypothetical protein
MDLDIEHYSLQELLKLFKLNENFTSAEFKDARRIVHALHPDKCDKDIKYYLFFKQAYSLLESVNSFKHKIEENVDAHLTFNEIIDGMADHDKKQIVDSLSVNPDFNKEFNALFEKYYLKEDDTGYGDWLQSNEDMNVTYEDRKKQSRSIMISIIDASSKDNQFTDLKSAYTVNSVLGVSEEDFVQRHKNIQELKRERDTQIAPLNTEQASQQLAQQEERESRWATQQAFKYVKQTEKNKTQQKSFWSHMLTLKH